MASKDKKYQLSEGRKKQLEQARRNAKNASKQSKPASNYLGGSTKKTTTTKKTSGTQNRNNTVSRSTGGKSTVTNRNVKQADKVNSARPYRQSVRSLGDTVGITREGRQQRRDTARQNNARHALQTAKNNGTLKSTGTISAPAKTNTLPRANAAKRTSGTMSGGTARKTGKTWNEKEERQKAIDTLNANSLMWHNTTDEAERNRLHEANNQIRKSFGMTYRDKTGATYLPKAGGTTNVSMPVVKIARGAALNRAATSQAQRQQRVDELDSEIERMQKQYPYLINMDVQGRNTADKAAAIAHLATHPKLAIAGINGSAQYDKMSADEKKQAQAIYQLYKRLNDESNALGKMSAAKSLGSGAANMLLNATGAVENAGRYVSGTMNKAAGDFLDFIGKDKAGQFLKDTAQKTLEGSLSDKALQALNEWAQPVGMAKKGQEFAGSAARMAPGIAANMALPGASLAMIYGDSAKSGVNEAQREGATLDQAMLYGTGAGLTELGTEKMFSGIPGMGEGVIKTGNGILGRAADILGEGAEEAASTFINPYLKRATYNPNAQNATAKELLDSAKGGIAMSALMQGASGAANRLADYRYGTDTNTVYTSPEEANRDMVDPVYALPNGQRFALPEGSTRTANTLYANENGGVANNLRAFNDVQTPDVLYGNMRGDFTASQNSGNVLYAGPNGQVAQSLPTGYLPEGRSTKTKIGARGETRTIPLMDEYETNGGLYRGEMEWAKLLIDNSNETGVPIKTYIEALVDPAEKKMGAALEAAEQYVKDYKKQGVSIIQNGDGTGYRASNNEDWYSQFHKKYGRAPRKSDAADIAREFIQHDLRSGGGNWVSPELAREWSEAQQIQAAYDAIGDDAVSAEITPEGLKVMNGTRARTEDIRETNAGRNAIVSPAEINNTAQPLDLNAAQGVQQGAVQTNPALRDINPKLRTAAQAAQESAQNAPSEITQPMQGNAQGAALGAQQTAQANNINPTLKKAEVNAESSVGAAETPFGQNTVGAAQSAYAPEQKVSKVSSNTFANSTIFNDAEKQSAKIFDQDGDALYDVVTEKQSLDNARQRLDTDYDGEVRDLPNKPNFSGEDNDTAMGILSRKLEEARQSGDYSEVNKWAKLIKEKGTEGGQLVQSFAKYSRTPEGVIVQGQREIDAAVKLLEKTNPKQLAKWQKKGYFQWTDADAQRSADYMQQAVDAGLDTQQGRTLEAKAMEVIADKMPVATKNKIVSLLMDNMLGNFRTLITRNAGGNAMFSAPEAIRENFVAAPIDKLVSLKTKARTTYASPFAKSKAWAGGAKKGVSEMASDIKNGVHTARSGENTSWQAQQKTFRDKGLGKLGNAYDSFVGSMLEAGDRPFYEAAFAAKMTDLEKARSQGKLTKDFQGKDFDTYAPQVARQAALEAVFQNNGTVAQAFSNIATGLGKLSKGTLGTASLQQSALPFTKTPGNLVERAIEYSPFGVLKNAVQTGHEKRTGTFNQQRFVTETSRNIVGSAIFALAGSLVASGMLRGALPDDKDEAEALKNAGEQAYSIRIGDKNYSYSWIPVIGPALAGAADFYQTMNDMDGNKAAAVWNAAEGYLNSAIFEQSSLSSLPDLFGGSYSTPIEGIGKTFASLPSQMVPSMVRQVATATDPYERQTYVKGNTIESQLNSIKASIPWLRQTLPVKVDEQGNEKLNSQGRGLGSRLAENMILPYKVTQQQGNDVRDELMRLKKATGETTQFQNKITYAVEHDGKKKNLTAMESMQYQKIYGQESTKAIRELMASDTYKGLSDKEKVRAITEINSYAKTIADSNFVNIELSEAEQKVKNAVDKGIGIGDYMVFKNSVKSIEDKNTGADDSSKKNMQDIVDLFENGSFAKLTDEQKDYLYSSTGRSLATNPYHISEVEKSASDSSYYKNLSGEDKLIFRSYANEYEDAVNNGKSMDGWVAKAKLASDNGVLEPYQFAAYEQALMYADKDENGSLKQSEVAAAINTISGLSQTQKAYLWQSQNKSWKPNKNPFGSATVYWPEAKEKDNSVEAKVDRRIGGMQASQKTSSAGFVNPTTASNSVVTSGYGGRNAPKTSGGYGSSNHDGIDIGGTGGNLDGQAAGSINSGKVTEVGYDANGYGNYVVVDHGDGYTSLYGHLQKATVKQGDTVSAGQQVGVIGSTGKSSGPHLHLRVHKNGQSIDPRTVIPGYGG